MNLSKALLMDSSKRRLRKRGDVTHFDGAIHESIRSSKER